ncbi:hypothetical protein NL676_025832 [Syzygium grande]|nr:hypothetical protein NL676_025832 [Syzygium grande]
MFPCKVDNVVDLILVDETITVGVRCMHHVAALPPREPSAGDPGGVPELLLAHAPVIVSVKSFQPPLELLHAHHTIKITIRDASGFDRHCRCSKVFLIFVC